MKFYATIGFFSALLNICSAANLDRDGFGNDLGGWTENTVVFGRADAVFEVDQPILTVDAAGNSRIATPFRQIYKGSPVFEATISMTASPDGLVRRIVIEGTVNGRAFETGEISRPDPVVSPVEPEPAEGTAAPSPAPEEPRLSPDQLMVQDALDRLHTQIERARNSKKPVKRDLSSWLFTRDAAVTDVLIKGAEPVLKSLVRRLGP